MCGIVGGWGRVADALSDAALDGALLAIAHRGPNDSGLQRGPGCALGHRRLSILDLSAAGHQPMRHAASGCSIVFNGEIYNFRELRAELETLGHVFHTSCDTEVLLAAYVEWREACLPRLVGMFAFAIIDPAAGSLFLARDRLGKKPLFYAASDDGLLFASEVRALHGLLPATTIDRAALASYLMFRYPVDTESFFNEIRALPAGQWLRADADGLHRAAYWDCAAAFAEAQTAAPETLPQTVLAELDRAVQTRMVADVEIGAYLSGGVDSSGVVALMARHSMQPVHTFCAGFSHADFNEFAWARQVAEHCHTRHTEIMIGEEDYQQQLPLLIRNKAAPLSVPNEVALYQMSLQLAQHVKVVMSGEGADEIFAGYGRIYRLPVDHARYVSGSVSYRLNFEKQYGSYHADEGQQFLQAYRYASAEEVLSWLKVDAAVVHDQLGSALLRRTFLPQLPGFFERINHFFLKVHLPGLLARLDFTSMQASVEARNPFLDHRLVELTARIPGAARIIWRDGESEQTLDNEVAAQYSEQRDIPKALLKRALEPYLPHGVLYRRKMGFPVPLRHWFGSMSQSEIIALLCHNAGASADYVNWDHVAGWIETLPQPLPQDAGQKLWMLYNLKLFLAMYA